VAAGGSRPHRSSGPAQPRASFAPRSERRRHGDRRPRSPRSRARPIAARTSRSHNRCRARVSHRVRQRWRRRHRGRSGRSRARRRSAPAADGKRLRQPRTDDRSRWCGPAFENVTRARGLGVLLPTDSRPILKRVRRVALLVVVIAAGIATGCGNDRTNARGTVIRRSPRLGVVWAPAQRGYGQVKPPTVDNGGDPTGLVEHVRWIGWGTDHAVGTGKGWGPPANGPYSDFRHKTLFCRAKSGFGCAEAMTTSHGSPRAPRVLPAESLAGG
jgi:hypothetical protein